MLTELEAAIHTHDDDLIRKTLQELEGATLRVRREIVRLGLEVA